MSSAPVLFFGGMKRESNAAAFESTMQRKSLFGMQMVGAQGRCGGRRRRREGKQP